MTDPDEISEFITWLQDQGYTIEGIEGDKKTQSGPVPGTRREYSVDFSTFDKADLPEDIHE